ncbi:putative transmembrane protein, partial [Toxoplasma gondii TgCatPRC2]
MSRHSAEARGVSCLSSSRSFLPRGTVSLPSWTQNEEAGQSPAKDQGACTRETQTKPLSQPRGRGSTANAPVLLRPSEGDRGTLGNQAGEGNWTFWVNALSPRKPLFFRLTGIFVVVSAVAFLSLCREHFCLWPFLDSEHSHENTKLAPGAVKRPFLIGAPPFSPHSRLHPRRLASAGQATSTHCVGGKYWDT